MVVQRGSRRFISRSHALCIKSFCRPQLLCHGRGSSLRTQSTGTLLFIQFKARRRCFRTCWSYLALRYFYRTTTTSRATRFSTSSVRLRSQSLAPFHSRLSTTHPGQVCLAWPPQAGRRVGPYLCGLSNGQGAPPRPGSFVSNSRSFSSIRPRSCGYRGAAAAVPRMQISFHHCGWINPVA